MEKRKYLAPERYEETAKLYLELSIEWRADSNEERAERYAQIARAEAIRAVLAHNERRGTLRGLTAAESELSMLDRFGKVRQ
tara:strand:- start:1464 stop:1709 length:246 start_codon:yes stop_codon:yes gene_type:complete